MTTVVIQNGGFSKISDLEFRDSVFKKGKEIHDNLFNVQETKNVMEVDLLQQKYFVQHRFILILILYILTWTIKEK